MRRDSGYQCKKDKKMKFKHMMFAVLMLMISPVFAQSGYMNPEEGYITQDHFEEIMYSAFDVHGDILYGYDVDGLHAMSLTSGTELYTIAKPAGYAGQPAFVYIEDDGNTAWLGLTVTGNTDDRVFSCDLSSQVWEQKAVLAGNFGMDDRGEDLFVSGLGAGTYGDPNCIWKLDETGANNHLKVIETGGSSAGLAIDEEGNVYYATYFFSEDNIVYKWNSNDVDEVLAGNIDPLTVADAEKLSDLPSGAYDCEMDEAGNLTFNCNDFTNGGFVAVWNGVTGAGENYIKTATTTEWMTTIAATGDVNGGGKIFTLAWAKPIASIQKEATLEVAEPIADINTPKNSDLNDIDLLPVFAPSGELVYDVASNTNSSLITATIDGSDLLLSTTDDMTGEAEITIRATLGSETAETSFSVSVFDYDYTNGVFIVNEDWFGHDNGTVNFLTGDGDFVYRAFRKENPGQTLGVTTQYSTTWGNHIFFMSKQGSRFVVVNAETLAVEASFEDINGDGRACTGVDENHVYVGHSDGIRIFNLETMEFDGDVSGISGETYNMIKAENYVFVIQENAIQIIENDAVVQSITDYPGVSGLTRAKDGDIYAGAGSTLVRISPYTLEHETVALPSGVTIAASNSVWNSGSLCASTMENVLYWNEDGGWGGSHNVYRYEIGNSSSLDTPLATLPTDWVTYGAGIRVHPVTKEIYLTAKMDGWGANSSFNRVYVFDGVTGDEKAMYEMEEYYWFPAMPMMPDVFAPQIAGTINSIEVDMNAAPVTVDLSEYVYDMDNIAEGISFKVTAVSGDEIIETVIDNNTLEVSFLEGLFGTCEITVLAVSNGKTVEFTIPVVVDDTTGLSEITKKQSEVYPNPVISALTINSEKLIESIEIRNINGHLLQQNVINAYSADINVANLSQGYYFVFVITEDGREVHKVVKQ